MKKNPFLENFAVPVARIIKRDVPHYKEVLEKNEYFDVEKIAFVRLYKGQDAEDKMKVFFSLSANALRLVIWIMYNLARNSDQIVLDDAVLSALLEVSDRQMQRIRAELIAAAIIAKCKENIYWVNPRYFTSGDRKQMYSNHLSVDVVTRENAYQAISMFEDALR